MRGVFRLCGVLRVVVSKTCLCDCYSPMAPRNTSPSARARGKKGCPLDSKPKNWVKTRKRVSWSWGAFRGLLLGWALVPGRLPTSPLRSIPWCATPQVCHGREPWNQAFWGSSFRCQSVKSGSPMWIMSRLLLREKQLWVLRYLLIVGRCAV